MLADHLSAPGRCSAEGLGQQEVQLVHPGRLLSVRSEDDAMKQCFIFG